MRITLKEANKLVTYNSTILNSIIDAMFDGRKHIEVPQHEYKLALSKYQMQKEKDAALASCAKLNNKGIALEKAGNIKAAIKIYEKNILNGYPAHHSHKRLMVLYHKQKDYENEIRVIERALEIFGNYPEYNERLIKVNKLIE